MLLSLKGFSKRSKYISIKAKLSNGVCDFFHFFLDKQKERLYTGNALRSAGGEEYRGKGVIVRRALTYYKDM
jgi:hypothetical protein